MQLLNAYYNIWHGIVPWTGKHVLHLSYTIVTFIEAHEKGALLKTSQIPILTAAVLLAGLTLIAGSSADAPAKAGDVNEARVLADASHGANWMVDGGDFGERHFSALKEINDKNVNNLGLAWSLDIDSPMGMAVGADRCGRPNLRHRFAFASVRGGRAVRASVVEVRSEDIARHEHPEFLFGASESRRGGLEWEGVRGHGRLPSVCDRRRLGNNRCGRRPSAIRQLPEPPALLTSPREKYLSVTTDRTTTSADRWSLSTRRPGKKPGDFGQFRVIPRRGSNRRHWKWPPRPGPASSGGGSAVEMSGTRSLTIPQPVFCFLARREPESAKVPTLATTLRAATNCLPDASSQ